MNAPQERKHAAILFADIVGYTALMQANEPQALSFLQKFKSELESKVSENQGEIVQFYGDGCLATFNSSVDAVTCAEQLQLAFQDAPSMPVRIGLHAGDVVYREGNVFGDAVNIASRIESMGVPGAVLLSSNVRNQIKNQPGFELESLGRFEFKNVTEGMTVYALANKGLSIPKREELKGKQKEPIQLKSKKQWQWIIPVLLIASLFGLYQWYQSANTNTIQANILKERIAVLPFENQTNDPALDIMGVMAADWGTRGLMRIEDATIVSPNTVTQHLNAAGILPNNKENKTSFSELTGAKTILRGKYYQEKEEVVFHLEITDAVLGNILYSFNPIRGSLLEKEKTIELLTEKVTGFWATKNDVLQKKHKAPKYEAYKTYLLGLHASWASPTAFQEIVNAIELDSTFYLARLHLILRNSDEIFLANAPHLDFLERHKDQLSFYELKYYNYLRGYHEGDYLYAQQSIEVLRNKYPKDLMINTISSINGLWGLRNLNLGLDIGEELNINNYDPVISAIFYGSWVHNRMWALHHLKRYQEAVDFFESLPSEYHLSLPHPETSYIYNLIQLSKSKEVLNILNNAANNSQVDHNTLSLILTMVGRHFLVVNQPEYAKKVANILSKTLKQHREKMPLAPVFDGSVLGLNENWEAIADMPYQHLAPYPYYGLVLGNKGLGYIKTNQLSKVQGVFDELDDYYAQNMNRTAFTRASALYSKGMLYAQLGDKEKAVQFLKQSIAEGIRSNNFPFEMDPYLKPLEGYKPYEELLKPIEVRLKD